MVKCTENKSDKKTLMKMKKYEEELTKAPKMTQRTKHLNSCKETEKKG